MTDTKELRRLAQKATPGPWEISEDHRFPGVHAWGEVVFGGSFCDYSEPIKADQAFIAAANPAAVIELLDRLEAAEQTVKDYMRIDREKSQIAQRLEEVEKERDALRAKVAEMEQQEPVAWYSKRYGFVYMSRQPSQFERGSILYLRNGAPAWRIEGSSKVALLDMSSLPHGTVFYALPGAQAQPAPSVPREAIEKMLTQLMDIAVSNGANSVSMPDEYVEVAAWLCGIPAQPVSNIPEGWKLVPIEPTEKMINEGTCASTLPGPRYIDSACAKQCWTNMLAAAPEAKP